MSDYTAELLRLRHVTTEACALLKQAETHDRASQSSNGTRTLALRARLQHTAAYLADNLRPEKPPAATRSAA